jgi:hypothetical protein
MAGGLHAVDQQLARGVAGFVAGVGHGQDRHAHRLERKVRLDTAARDETCRHAVLS